MARKLCLMVLAFVISWAAVRAVPSGANSSAFDELKILVGEWEGMNSGGPVKATYTLVSGGTALMERLQSANEPEMITMYSADGNYIVATHYCSSGNQPQMKSDAMIAKPQKYSFSLVRITGMKTQDEGHMVGLVLTLVDRDHLTQEWKYQDKGKTSGDKFQFTRKPEKPATVLPSGS